MQMWPWIRWRAYLEVKVCSTELNPAAPVLRNFFMAVTGQNLRNHSIEWRTETAFWPIRSPVHPGLGTRGLLLVLYLAVVLASLSDEQFAYVSSPRPNLNVASLSPRLWSESGPTINWAQECTFHYRGNINLLIILMFSTSTYEPSVNGLPQHKW